MYRDVRLKAVKRFLGVSFLVTAVVTTVQAADTKTGTKSKVSSKAKSEAFLGPDAVMVTASDLTQNRVSPPFPNPPGGGNGPPFPAPPRGQPFPPPGKPPRP